MSVEIKVAPDDKLQLVQTYFTDNSPSSDFFNITELPDTLSGGKNAFLIAGSDKLFPQSEVKVQVRDADGNVCYVEYANGNPEYYEGISKVVAVYVYPTTTAFGPATITILGQAIDVPEEWQFRFNVKWERQININPSLPNTTRVRFYKRPKVDIVETLEPIYRIESGSKVATNVTASFANINVSQLETFAGDVKRVKVYRTSEGDISDYDLIQDILIESKELLTTFDITSSVKGNAGIFTNETLKLWDTGSLISSLTNDRLDNGVRLSGSGIFKYKTPLSFTTRSTYEFNLDAFYSSSAASNLGVYISGSNNGIKLIGTLEGATPVKNLEDTYFTFDVDKSESTASLYLSQSRGEWHVANLSLKLSEDSAFSPNQIDFITTMPTVVGNETYNFKFEFYDVNNNYVPVAITQSALFTGGNNNINGTLTLISGSISSSEANIAALSRSVSGTIGNVTASVSQSFVTSSAFSASLQSSSLFISSSISGTISNVSQSASSSLSLVSRSLSSSIGALSSSQATTFVDVNSRIFTDATGLVNKAPSNGVAGLYLGQSYLGYHNGNGLVTGWKTFMANNGNFFLTSSAVNGGYLAWDSLAATLEIKGVINITGGDAATTSSVTTAVNSGTASLSSSLAPNIFTDSTGKVVRPPTNTAANFGLYLGSSNLGFYSGSTWRTYMDNTGQFFLTGSNSNYLKWNGSTLTIAGSIDITGGSAQTQITTAQTTANTATASAIAAGQAATTAATAANYALVNANTASIQVARDAAGWALINANTASIFTNASGLINKTPTTGSTSGLYLGQEYMGYYNGTVWKTYMQNNGNFFLSGTNGFLSWNAVADTLGIKGDVTATNITATNTGNIAGWTVNAANGLQKTTGAYTLRLGSSAQKISITQQSTIDSIERLSIDASTSLPAISIASVGELGYSNANELLASANQTSPTNAYGDTGWQTANYSPTHPAYSGVYGIIGLIYGEEEIFVEPENFPDIETTIVGALGAEGNSFVRGFWECKLRVRRFPTSTDAVNQTNVDTTFGINGVIENTIAFREYAEYANNPDANINSVEVYGCTIPVTGGGGITQEGPAKFYRVEIIQVWGLDAYADTPEGIPFSGTANIIARRPASNITVKFGRVNGGYSVFSPGGLQVYQGFRNYLNASIPSGSTGDSSNFFTVKGKSQIIGSLNVSSGFSAGFKNFRIEHPLNENKWLYHTSTESPRADLIYRGTLQLQSGEGSASIDSASNMMIGTFDVLTKNPQLFLQNNESFDRIKGYVQSGSVYVLSENQNSTASIDWSVIAERQDVQILKSPLYDTNGNYRTENWKGEYLELTREERLLNYSGSI
jgi:hypothetical protein